MGTWDGDGPMIWTHHVTGRYMLTLGNGEYLDSGRLPVVGQWQHVGATYDGAVARFYIDGVEVANRAFTGDASTSNVWRIGAFRSTPTGYFDGLIDNVRIYSRALPAAELNADVTTSVAAADNTAPSTPTGLEQVAATGTTVDLRWSPSTDNLRVAGYRVYRGPILEATVTSESARLTGLTCGGSAVAGVEAFDGAGNVSGRATLTVTAAPCDLAPPTITLTAPASGSTLNGTVVVAAAAADDVGVTDVSFSIDGDALGSPDADVPYTAAWNTRLVGNGAHTVSRRRARRRGQQRDRTGRGDGRQQRRPCTGSRRRVRLRCRRAARSPSTGRAMSTPPRWSVPVGARGSTAQQSRLTASTTASSCRRWAPSTGRPSRSRPGCRSRARDGTSPWPARGAQAVAVQ